MFKGQWKKEATDNLGILSDSIRILYKLDLKTTIFSHYGYFVSDQTLGKYLLSCTTFFIKHYEKTELPPFYFYFLMF